MSASDRCAASLQPGLAGRINPVCDRFEAQWLAGATPRLEEFLLLVDEADRPALVRELLELERELFDRRRDARVFAGDFYFDFWCGRAAHVAPR